MSTGVTMHQRPNAARGGTARPADRARPAGAPAHAGTQEAAPSLPLLGVAGGHRPGATEVLALQRTIGNRATAALLQRGAALHATTIQRQPTTDEVRKFARRYHQVVTALRKGKSIRRCRNVLTKLRVLAREYRFDTDLPSMFQQLLALAQLADQKKPDRRKVNATLSLFQPEARMGDTGFTAMAAAIFTPELTGGGEFRGESTRELGKGEEEEEEEMEEKEEKEKEGDSVGVDVDARINFVLARIRAAYSAHRRALGRNPTARFDQTLLVFVGPEWYFRRPDRPYTRRELQKVQDTIVAISALFPEMLIMPGTIISADWRKKKGWENLTNTAIVAWNGNLLHTIDKFHDAGDTKGLTDPSKYQKGEQPATFTLGQLTFAIDICADFMFARAQKEMEKADKEADVHLISGAGQALRPEYTATRHGGFAVRAEALKEFPTISPATFAQIKIGNRGREGKQYPPDVLEQERREQKVVIEETGQVVSKTVLTRPRLSYYRTLPFSRRMHPMWATSPPRTPGAAPRLRVLDARSGATIATRPLPAPSSENDEPVTAGGRRSGSPEFFGQHRGRRGERRPSGDDDGGSTA